MAIDLDKLEAAAKEATQDEWEFWNGYVATDIDSDGGVIICNRPTPSGGKFQKQIDANFKYIATANPQAVLELISELEGIKGHVAVEFANQATELRKQRDDLLAALEDETDAVKQLMNWCVKNIPKWNFPQYDNLCFWIKKREAAIKSVKGGTT